MEQLDIKLKSKHIAPFCKILSKIGIDKVQYILDFESMAKTVSDTTNQVEVGMKIILPIVALIIENYPNAEKEINSFISSVTNIKRIEEVEVDEVVTDIKRIEEIEIDEFAEILYQIFTCDSFKRFFEVVKKFMQ